MAHLATQVHFWPRIWPNRKATSFYVVFVSFKIHFQILGDIFDELPSSSQQGIWQRAPVQFSDLNFL